MSYFEQNALFIVNLNPEYSKQIEHCLFFVNCAETIIASSRRRVVSLTIYLYTRNRFQFLFHSLIDEFSKKQYHDTTK